MDTNQIYSIVNDVVQQAFGSTTQPVVNSQNLVALGNTVLTSTTNTEAFLNTLVQRIGYTIYSYRRYYNKLRDMVVTDFEWGAILQKIRVRLSNSLPDPTFQLVDGQSIDQYRIYKPQVTQKLFVSRTPYMYAVTISKPLLREAFTGPEGMQRLISIINGQVVNSIELAFENLGRLALYNMGAETTHVVDLLTDYNTATNSTFTAQSALLDDGFLRYAVSTIHLTSKAFTDYSTMYNDGTIETFTPIQDQRLKVNALFESRLETVVQYSAFHKELVDLGVYVDLSYWQNPQTPMDYKIIRASDGKQVNRTNVVAMLYDREACGLYRRDEEVNTTPLNAAARYYNTFWHEQQLWFNDLSENFIIFTLGPQAAPVTPTPPTPEETATALTEGAQALVKSGLNADHPAVLEAKAQLVTNDSLDETGL